MNTIKLKMRRYTNFYSLIVGLLFLLSIFLLINCSTSTEIRSAVPYPTWERIDAHSYANLKDIHTVHLHLDLDINFENQTIYGVARHQMSHHQTNQAVFDIKNIDIQRITKGNGEERSLDYEIGQSDSIMGTPLIVAVDSSVEYINIYYKTTPQSEALDWLPAHLTEGKKHPFLYSQGQSVLTRTWIPLQDSPSNRITYSATVRVPPDLLPIMSATNPTTKNDTGLYHFSMHQPIPSYLIAIAVGDFHYQSLGDHCGFYSEPELIDASLHEFTDLERMLAAAQKLYGDYRWEQYDLVILPYSFPFGGMENPRLTFVNPTLLAGDRSLVTVIAHELAHSWSGNLVTNASWEDFWLNEGFTVYFENRIMEELYGKEVALIHQQIEFLELQETLKRLPAADTRLKLNLSGRDPNEAMTDIAYIKGAYFLRTIEQKVGRKKFDLFLQNYFEHYAFQTLSTEEFVAYLDQELLSPNAVYFNTDEWIYGIGLPANCVQKKGTRLDKIEKYARQTVKNPKKLTTYPFHRWITQEWVAFIRSIPDTTAPDILREIDQIAQLKNSTNSEIICQWYTLAIRCGYTDIKPELKDFISRVGRLKYLEPIYEALKNSPDKTDKIWARKQLEELKTVYHPLTRQAIEHILNG